MTRILKKYQKDYPEIMPGSPEEIWILSLASKIMRLILPYENEKRAIRCEDKDTERRIEIRG